jgi:hypothetical protein
MGNYKVIRFAGFSSSILGIMFVVIGGLQTFGVLSPTESTGFSWMVGWLGFSMLGTVATASVKLLESQADQIAHLQRQLSDRVTT